MERQRQLRGRAKMQKMWRRVWQEVLRSLQGLLQETLTSPANYELSDWWHKLVHDWACFCRPLQTRPFPSVQWIERLRIQKRGGQKAMHGRIQPQVWWRPQVSSDAAASWPCEVLQLQWAKRTRWTLCAVRNQVLKQWHNDVLKFCPISGWSHDWYTR